MPNAEGRMRETATYNVPGLLAEAERVAAKFTAHGEAAPLLRGLAAALAAARAENERMRADLDAVRKVVQLQADRDWIIVPWLNDAGDYVWRVNVRDVPSKKKGADTYTGTEHVGATPLDAGLRALAAQEGTR